MFKEKTVKASVILRTAAKRINTALKLSCLARMPGCTQITDVGYCLGANASSTEKAFKYFRKFRPKNAGAYWFGKTFSKAEQECRIIALLLAADIAESEGN